MEEQFSYYMIWGNTCEGNRRWHMGRFIEGTTSSEVFDLMNNNILGGCGDDYAEILEIENGWEDDAYTDYIHLQTIENK